MKLMVPMLLCAILAGGCTITYTHPTKNAGDFERDRRECEVIARQNLAARGIPDT